MLHKLGIATVAADAASHKPAARSDSVRASAGGTPVFESTGRSCPAQREKHVLLSCAVLVPPVKRCKPLTPSLLPEAPWHLSDHGAASCMHTPAARRALQGQEAAQLGGRRLQQGLPTSPSGPHPAPPTHHPRHQPTHPPTNTPACRPPCARQLLQSRRCGPGSRLPPGAQKSCRRRSRLRAGGLGELVELVTRRTSQCLACRPNMQAIIAWPAASSAQPARPAAASP